MKPFFTLVVFILLSASVQGQYCMLPGRTPYSDQQPGITNFKLNTINRTSANVEDMGSVVVVTTDSTTLKRGQTYTVSLTHSRDSVFFPTARNNIRIWIDYNNNKSFEDAGEIVVSADLKAVGVFTATFTVPTTAPLGTVRLRATAKMSSDAGHTLPSSCDSPSADPLGYHGEIEDYKVKIVSATEIEPLNNGDGIATVFPNPTAGQLNVIFNSSSNTPVAIDVLDVTGRLVGNVVKSSTRNSSYTADLTNMALPDGVYLVRITSDAGTQYHKIVKSE